MSVSPKSLLFKSKIKEIRKEHKKSKNHTVERGGKSLSEITYTFFRNQEKSKNSRETKEIRAEIEISYTFFLE